MLKPKKGQPPQQQRGISTVEGGLTSGSLTGVLTALVIYLKDAFPGQPDSLWILISTGVAFLVGGGIARLVDVVRYPAQSAIDQFENILERKPK